MGVLVSLSPSEIEVNPGEQAQCELQIRNSGSVVDQFTLELIGDLGEWATVEPRIINLFPDAESHAKVVFKPPKESEPVAGEIPFAVRVSSREDPEGSCTEEGSVTVLPFTDISAEIVPHGSRGAFMGRHRLAIDNRGNVATPVQIGLTDQDNVVRFKIRRQAVVTEPGTATLIPIRVLPKKRFLKGPKQTLPFQAVVTGEGFDPVTADAAMVQEQMLPKWAPGAFAAAVALALVLVGLYFTVLRPVIKTAATSAAVQQNQSLASSVQQAQQQVQQAQQQAQSADTNAQKALVAAGAASPSATPSSPPPASTPTPSSTPSASPTSGGNSGSTSAASPAGTPIDFTLQSNAAAGHAGTFQTVGYTVPAGRTLLISDFVVSNPNGDSGVLDIRRGNETLIPLGLDNFRSYDQHFVQPIEISGGQMVVLAVDCHNTSAACTPSAYFSGQIR